MKETLISKGGQVSIPASVRHRWGTNRIALEDRGTALVIRPVPDDPIGAAIGSLKGSGPSTDRIRALVREEEADTDERREARR
jgi:bifunctional DNA-binding transcriptional regulator/antitoxin component of YhaV-PrlF toxin-antitoxin module